MVGDNTMFYSSARSIALVLCYSFESNQHNCSVLMNLTTMRTITTKLFAVILSILAFGAMTSCTNDLDYDYGISEADLSEQPQSPYHITLSEALGDLELMMNEMGMENTRALQRGEWTVQRIPLSAFKLQTRSGGEAEAGDAIYVVNFDNDEGFAILSADDRLPDNVIAMSSKGSIIVDIEPYIDDEDSLTLEDLYVPEDDDYLLGSVDPNRVIGGLVTNYVRGKIGTIGIAPGKDGNILIPPSNPITYSYQYKTVEYIPEMLTTTWHQRSPYNDKCPNRYYYRGFLGITYTAIKPYDFDAVGEWGSDFIRDEDLAAGCVAIAVAQILAYNEYPALSDVLGENVEEDWEWLLADHYAIPDPDEEAEAIARQNELYAKLVHKVGVGCDMNYGFYKQQSFTTPAAARRYLISLGYANVCQYNDLLCVIDRDIVINQLRDGIPVFIGAISGVIDGHAWVIDGYKLRCHVRTGRNSDGEIVSSEVVGTNHYVHCNWGWRNAQNNGWFTYGLFDIGEAYSYDNINQRSEERDYDHLFRVITYDKPDV